MPAASTPTERWIIVPRWEEFQHRDAARVLVPTWIKFMTRLLSDEAYLGLTGHRRAILHGIWLEYARSLRQLPDNTTTLSRRLALKVTRRDLDALNHAGFIHFSASTDASMDASTSAGTEKRREVLSTPKAVTSQETPDDDEPDLGNTHPPNGRPSDHTTVKTAITRSLEEARP